MRSIFSYWQFDPIIMGFVFLLCTFYLYGVSFRVNKRSVYFFSGILLLIICVASPLHFIAENYLFSAHMTIHVLLLLIVAPLLVTGIPEQNKFKNILMAFSKKLNAISFLCWLAGVGVMWFWHIPYIFNQLFIMHDIQHSIPHTMGALMYIHLLSLLIAGIIFCWPVVNPYNKYRLHSPAGVLYLSTACIFCSLLGLLITFSSAGTYSYYAHLMDHNGYLSMIRNKWGISAGTDRQIGGLIMWVPCCFIYLSASMYLLVKWFDNKKEELSFPDITIAE